MDFLKTMSVAAAGMKAQGTRMRVGAQNLANADSTAATPGGEPYRRKLVTFREELDRATGVSTVKARDQQRDNDPFVKRYDPAHPAADRDGFVLYPNVNSAIEMANLKEAQRSYEANLSSFTMTRNMALRTVEILKA